MEMVLVRDTAPKYYDALKKSGQNYDFSPLMLACNKYSSRRIYKSCII